jgi:predicted Zn-dependent peptidase
MLNLEQYELGNGLRVVLNEDHSAPLVAINLWYHVGSKNERMGRTGFAHLFEHMLFSGSSHVANNEHFHYVQSVGGVLNGSTNFDRTNYFETLPSNYLELGLWLESDRMGFLLPALTQKKLDIQKEVVKEERRQRYDNVPYGTALERALKLAFKSDYPYSWPTIGSMSDLTAAQLDDVSDFFRTYYAPNNAVLTLVGDFDPTEARSLVEKYFAGLPRGPVVPKFSAERAPLGGEKREVVVSPVQLGRIYRLYPIPRFGEREWFAADLLTNILSNDKSSRLDRALVYEQRLAQEVSSFVFPSEGTGLLILYTDAKPGVDLEKLESALDHELESIARDGITADELSRSKTQNETAFARQLATFASRADLLSMLTTFFDDPTLATHWNDRYDAVTTDDVKRVVTDFLQPSNRVTLHFVPEKSGEIGGAK